MSHARAIDWPEAIRQSGKFFEPVLHHVTHVFHEPHVREGRRHTPDVCKCQQKERVKDATVRNDVTRFITFSTSRNSVLGLRLDEL